MPPILSSIRSSSLTASCATPRSSAARTSLPARIAASAAGSTPTWSGPSCARLSKGPALRRAPSGPRLGFAPRTLDQGQTDGVEAATRPKDVWSIRSKLQIEGRTRDLAMFNLAIDSKLRGCVVVHLKVEDVAPHGRAVDRATVRTEKLRASDALAKEHMPGTIRSMPSNRASR